MERIFAKDIEKEVLTLFKENRNLNVEKVALSFNVSIYTIYRILKNNNIKRHMPTSKRKYNLNHKTFDKIDTPEKAYWLGFLYADGYIHYKRNEIKISLAPKDVCLLKQFNSFLNSDYPIKYYKHKSGYNKDKDKKYPRILICSKKLVGSLYKWGCEQKKTFSLKYPGFIKGNKFEKYFILGYFDGDGCSTYSTDKYGTKSSAVNFTGNLSFTQSLQDYFQKHLNFSYTKKQYRNKGVDNVSIMYGGNNQIKRFYNHFYDTDLGLKRKKEVMYNILYNVKGVKQDF